MCLVKVDAGDLGATLNAKARLECPVPLLLVHPHELMDATPASFLPRHESPRSVALVVTELEMARRLKEDYDCAEAFLRCMGRIGGIYYNKDAL